MRNIIRKVLKETYGYRLTAEQLKFLQQYLEKNKKLDEKVLKYIGADNPKLRGEINKILIKIHGGPESVSNKIQQLLSSNTSFNTKCGGYDINFKVGGYIADEDTDGSYYISDVVILVDSNSTVVLDGLDGQTYTLKQIINKQVDFDEHVYEEIRYELEECILEKMEEMITNTYGFEVFDLYLSNGDD